MFVTFSRKYHHANIDKFWYRYIFDYGEANRLLFVAKNLPGNEKNDNLELNCAKMHYLHKITANTYFKTFAKIKIEFKFKMVMIL